MDFLVKILEESTFTVVLTGAGISTPSGLPDYRGPNGLWTNADKENLKTDHASRYRLRSLWNEELIKPNVIHNTLAKLVKQDVIQGVISQNIDNLHQRSGIPVDKLLEIHGNYSIMKCFDCDSRFKSQDIGWDVNRFGRGYRKEPISADQPTCSVCDGRIISSIVNFGDPLPRKESKTAHEWSRKCDLFLVMGSSLTVAPASLYPKVAKKKGAKLIINNLQPTPLDGIADCLFTIPSEEFIVEFSEKSRHTAYPETKT